jgi:hypothetical protein
MRARATSRATLTTSASGIGPADIRSRSVRPSTNGIV